MKARQIKAHFLMIEKNEELSCQLHIESEEGFKVTDINLMIEQLQLNKLEMINLELGIEPEKNFIAIIQK